VVSTDKSGAHRDAHLDNCKFWLMCAVVMNHCFQDFFKVLDPDSGRGWCGRDSYSTRAFGYRVDLLRLGRGFYMYLNLLGMPAFICVSGFCSKGWRRDVSLGDGVSLSKRYRGLVESLIVPWLIWQPFYVLYNYRTYPVQLWSPIGVTWYLTALFFWRSSISILAQIKTGILLPLLFLCAIAVGFTETPDTSNGLAFLDFQRGIAFLPVFYVGACAISGETYARMKSGGAVKRIGWVVTIGAVAVFTAMIDGAHTTDSSADGTSEDEINNIHVYCFDEIQRYLWMQGPYVDDGEGGTPDTPSGAPLEHAMYRVIFFVFAFLCMGGFAAVVPTDQKWYTAYGSRTMYAYLLHLVVIRGVLLIQDIAVPENLQPPIWGRAIIGLVLLPLLGTVGLMSPTCKRLCHWVVEPKVLGKIGFWEKEAIL
jgi:fucose 4-O-acetylase-like acetyltransferase